MLQIFSGALQVEACGGALIKDIILCHSCHHLRRDAKSGSGAVLASQSHGSIREAPTASGLVVLSEGLDLFIQRLTLPFSSADHQLMDAWGRISNFHIGIQVDILHQANDCRTLTSGTWTLIGLPKWSWSRLFLVRMEDVSGLWRDDKLEVEEDIFIVPESAWSAVQGSGSNALQKSQRTVSGLVRYMCQVDAESRLHSPE